MSKSKPISTDNIDKYVQLGLNIAYFRKLKGMTQEQLAEKVGISRSHLSSIGAPNIIKAFSIELLFEIADALQIVTFILCLLNLKIINILILSSIVCSFPLKNEHAVSKSAIIGTAIHFHHILSVHGLL